MKRRVRTRAKKLSCVTSLGFERDVNGSVEKIGSKYESWEKGSFEAKVLKKEEFLMKVVERESFKLMIKKLEGLNKCEKGEDLNLCGKGEGFKESCKKYEVLIVKAEKKSNLRFSFLLNRQFINKESLLEG